MNRIYDVQTKMLAKIAEFSDSEERDQPLDWERVHMVSCAKIGQIFALVRGVDPELAAIACAVHDYGRVISGKQEDHAAAAYGPLKKFLGCMECFSPEEIELIALAAKNHSNKAEVGSPLEEIVKDADVLDCRQYGQVLSREEQKQRLAKIRAELGHEV